MLRLIDSDALKNSILDSRPDDLQQSDINFDTGDIKIWLSSVLKFIDNAKTVPLPDFKEGYKQAIIDGKTNFSRPQGEWIFHKDFNESCRYGCNQCGNLTNIPNNFCPNCGARMQKGGEHNAQSTN